VRVDSALTHSGFSRGPRNAAHTVVVFTDSFCPSCRELRETLHKLVQQRTDVRVVEHLLSHVTAEPRAWEAAVASVCVAGIDTGWRFRDALARDIVRTRTRAWHAIATEAGFIWTDAMDRCIEGP